MSTQTIQRIGLDTLPVTFVDTSDTSPNYFDIVYLPPRFTAGKNLIKIKGNSTTLLSKADVFVEVLDAINNPLYFEVLDYQDDDGTVCVQVLVQENTAPGNCTIYIATRAINIPELGLYNIPPAPGSNIKWKRILAISPATLNSNELVFVSGSLPKIDIKESINPYFGQSYKQDRLMEVSSSSTIKLIAPGTTKKSAKRVGTSTGQNRIGPNYLYKVIQPNPIIAASRGNAVSTLPIVIENNTLPTIQITSGNFIFSSSMVGGTVTVNNPIIDTAQGLIAADTSYTSIIVNVLNDTTAQVVDDLQFVYNGRGIKEFSSTPFTCSYVDSPIYTPSENYQSYIDVDIHNIRPATGDVYKIRTYMRPVGSAGEYRMINETVLSQQDILVDTGSLSGENKIGEFESLADITSYWSSSLVGPDNLFPIYDSNYNRKATDLKVTYSRNILNDAMQLDSLASYTQGDFAVIKLRDSYFPKFYKDDKYVVALNASVNADSIFQTNQVPTTQTKLPNGWVDVYVSGSAFDSNVTLTADNIQTNALGKYLGSVYINDGALILDKAFSFQADQDGTGTVLFAVRSGNVYLSNIHVYPETTAGQSPTRIRLQLPVPTISINAEQQFKFQYFDYQGNPADYETEVFGPVFAGGNTYIEGDQNVLTGSLSVGGGIGRGLDIVGDVDYGWLGLHGYDGFDNAVSGTGAPGVTTWSGSTTVGSTTYVGIGFELASDNAWLKFKAGAGQTSSLDIKANTITVDNLIVSGGIAGFTSSYWTGSSNGSIKRVSDVVITGSTYISGALSIGDRIAVASASRDLNLLGTNAVIRVIRVDPAGTNDPSIEFMPKQHIDSASSGYWDVSVRQADGSFRIRDRAVSTSADKFIFSGSLATVSASMIVTGSVTAPAFTGSLFGTSSWAQNAISSSYAISASFATTASYVNPLRQNVIVTGSVSFASSSTGTVWSMNTDGASIKFYNTGDGDTDSRLEFQTLDNNNEYFRWTHDSGGTTYESMRLVPNGTNNATMTVSGSMITTGNIGAGIGAFGSLIAKVNISASGNGAELLRFVTDRPWRFLQTGSGATANLELNSLNADKDFIVTSFNRSSSLEVRVSDTAGNQAIRLIPNSPTAEVTIGHRSAESGTTLDVSGSTRLRGEVRVGDLSSNFAAVEIGVGRTAAGYAYLDLVGDTTYTDYGFRIIRNNTGADATTVLAHRGTGSLSIATQNTASMQFITQDNSVRMFISSSGNVGIGTTAPAAPLHISGNAGILNLEGSNHAYMQWYPDGFAAGRKGWIGYGSSGDDNLSITNQTGSGGLMFRTNDTDRVFISSSGNVGIGTGTPTSLLYVDGTTSTPLVTLYQRQTVGSNANALLITGSTATDLVRITQTGIGNAFVVEDSSNPDATPFVIDRVGNVGMGTDSPLVRLSISGSIIVGDATIQIGNGVNNGTKINAYAGGTAVETSAYYSFVHAQSSTIDAYSSASAILGGTTNTINSPLESAIIAGSVNTITSSSLLNGAYNGILGGNHNTISGSTDNTIIGGNYNVIRNSESPGSIVSSWFSNLSFSTSSIIVGGYTNTISQSKESSILGGVLNKIQGPTNQRNSIIGGRSNQISSNGGFKSDNAIMGSWDCNVTSSDQSSVISSNFCNILSGSQCSIIGSYLSNISGTPGTVSYNIIAGGSSNKITTSNTGSYNTYGCGIVAGGSNTINDSTSAVIIGGASNKMNGRARTVIIGGIGINATADDMVYVPDLVIDGLTSVELATDANGKIVASTSDARLKQNINELTNSLDVINNLRGVSFEYTPESEMGNGIRYGFIAQEVQQFIPDIVRSRSKGDGMLSLNYNEIIPVLVEAVKTLSAENESLKSELQTIKTHLGL